MGPQALEQTTPPHEDTSATFERSCIVKKGNTLFCRAAHKLYMNLLAEEPTSKTKKMKRDIARLLLSDGNVLEEDGDVLEKAIDNLIVFAKQFSKERIASYRRLTHGKGSLTDALCWSRGEDPVSEVTIQLPKGFIAKTLGMEENQLEVRTAKAYECSAKILLTSVACPEIFTNPETVLDVGIRRPYPLDGETHSEGIADVALSELQDRDELSLEDLQNLNLCIELFQQSIINKLGVRGDLRQAFSFSANIDNKHKNDVLELISKHTIQKTEKIDLKNFDRYKIWLKAYWRDSILSMERDNTECQKKLVSIMIEQLNSVFISSNILDNRSDEEKTTIRGFLHELVWGLDAYMTMLVDNHKYGDMLLIPSQTGNDSPRINKPKYHRGYDHKIAKVRPGSNRKEYFVVYIELKSVDSTSTRKKSKHYHEYITVVLEKDFEKHMDSNWLKEKLGTYQKLLDNDLPREETLQALDRFACATVREEFDAINKESQSPNPNLSIVELP
ncbi:MAG: hypothetical protein LBQ11_02275 [Candidatus Nomurabacteria bacterium]|jgi:hypothetical protein|nr:hypothetical protein [Candidatus Nomurabacteria bacterium]